ncbi:hypothetical protein A8C56_08020 [Niabella ginsenosidivorans]|uniref:EpsG family protein n=1 Tax=Niabella ginsenosidivorans TaxID=1176587 RepID=A0A1A9HZY6_9BACT|nr:hypothetical protein A8C56_08020 [Niabella ginsenosidivorans]
MIINFIIITLFILCILFPKSKFIAFIAFLFMWQLWGWNSWNGDYNSYRLLYETIGRFGISSSDIEVGYAFMNKISYNLGLSFQNFMGVFSFIVLGLTYLFISRSPYPAILAMLYFLIFIMEFVFMRNYMADTFFLLFLGVVMGSAKQKKIKSFFLLGLALLFHNTAIVYFAFLIVFIDKIKPRKLFYIVASVVLVLFTSLTFFLSFISSTTINSKIAYYYTDASPIGPAIGHLLIVSSLAFFISYSKKYLSSLPAKVQENTTLFTKVNIISLIYIPLYFFLPNFSRFFKVLFVINLFYILYLIFFYQRRNYRSMLVTILVAVYLIIIYQFSYSTLDYTYYPLINSNLIYSDI